MTFYKITKIEASKRQLDCALELFLNDQDIVSIHTLASASQKILLDLKSNKKFKATSLIYDKLLAYVKDDKKSYFITKTRSYQNFFKHADNDPDGILEFNPEMNMYVLLDSILLYEQITNNISFWMGTYKAYFLLSNPELINIESFPESSKSLFTQTNLNHFIGDKKKFIEIMKDIYKIHPELIEGELIKIF
ncbi:MAG: hypothetical protein PHZ07_00955 [Patescibacteria group bacterium]|nr:hypothetical protein [Patescibacteria group bacterium]MDD4304638.1 hypothetical protein [Patescibacteria group bacterium]MDD4695565.1 hypothetical protein [Patescibacteria group bacterium]